MKIVIVGGVAAGASAAARLRRLDEHAEIIVFEQGAHVSFSNCSLPYHLSGVVADSDSLVMMTPESFRTRHAVDVRTNTQVISIDRGRKTVRVRSLISEEEYEESYDRLILATGAKPVLPRSIQGIGRSNVHVIRNVGDIVKIRRAFDDSAVTRIGIVGGGFIGIETAENARKAGKDVTLIEGTDQVLAPFDEEMAQILHKELDDHGVQLHLRTRVQAIEEDGIVAVRDGQTLRIPCDLVIMAVGVQPDTALAVQAGLQIGESGGIRVDHNAQTSDPDIYAIGDVAERFNALTHHPGRLALAGPAQRQARAAADHICGRQHSEHGFIGSSCIRVFDQNAAVSGLSEKAAKAAGIPCDSVLIFPNDKVSLMPECHYMAFKLIFEVPTGRILGAQAIGRGECDKRINVIAAMITMHASLEDLKELELCYAPQYSTAKDVVNQAALVALNVLYGEVRQVHVQDVRALAESGACIIDVREPGEYARGHLCAAKNIPLSQLRERMAEIPSDRPVYLHCRSSQRSYYALRCLQGNGYRNVFNISGSFLGICLYEHFRDQHEGRTPIVTAYCFD